MSRAGQVSNLPVSGCASVPRSTAARAARPPGATARTRAFTLVEVLVATIIVGLIATSVAIVISRTFKTRRTAEARTEASLRATAAAGMIARDLQNAFRDGDLLQTRVRIIPGTDNRDQLLLLARTDHTVRGSATALDTRGADGPSTP
ncbi:MAG: type II secretion system GspH family protein, partial [Phycisphaerales bacterium]|nr:type II secretion system GspH family protein [Phycisphaerales bacterium]